MEWLTLNLVWLVLSSFLIVIHFITYRSQRGVDLIPALIKHSSNRG